MMPHLPDNFEKLVDIVKPAFVGTTIVTVLTLSDFEQLLKIGFLLLSIGYSCWKWYSEYRVKKNK